MKNKIIIVCILVVMTFIFFSFNITKKEDVVETQMSGVSINEESYESENEDSKENINNKVEKDMDEPDKEKVKVDIKGAVVKPGVYEIERDKRVIDVINLAGGKTKDANTNYVNLSTKVADEMVIWIYTNQDIEDLNLKQTSVEYMVKECNCPVVDNTTCLYNENNTIEENNDTIININIASTNELMNISGIGESKAKSIVEYRTKNGKFEKIEDIMNVNGIGESLYNKIKEYIKV